MIRGCVLAVLVACLPALALAGEEASPPPPALEITYVANEGFLVQAAGRKIAIDTFFEGETIDWCDAPAPGTVEKMRSAKGPFEGIDLILVTHGHVDHFSPGLVLAHLASNPKAVFVASPQVTSRLRSDPSWTSRYEERIRAIDMPLFGMKQLTINGIHVEAHRIRHGAYMIKDETTGKERNKHENVENLAYLVDTGAGTFMHFGDAFLGQNGDYLDGKRFQARKIDVAFVEDWSDESLAILDKLLDPGTIVFMHLSPDPERVKKLETYVSSKVTNYAIFHRMMETRSVPLRSARSKESVVGF